MKEPSRNKVGTECGIESPIAYVTFNLEARIDFSFSTCDLSFFLSETFRIFIQEESILAKNHFNVEFNSS